jgi:hypothetical protein
MLNCALREQNNGVAVTRFTVVSNGVFVNTTRTSGVNVLKSADSPVIKTHSFP